MDSQTHLVLKEIPLGPVEKTKVAICVIHFRKPESLRAFQVAKDLLINTVAPEGWDKDHIESL